MKAEFSLKGSTLKGFISSDSRSGLDQLKKNSAPIETAAKENEVDLKQMDFGIVKTAETYSYQNPSLEEGSVKMKAETERTLYQIAKAVVRTVRLAESSG